MYQILKRLKNLTSITTSANARSDKCEALRRMRSFFGGWPLYTINNSAASCQWRIWKSKDYFYRSGRSDRSGLYFSSFKIQLLMVFLSFIFWLWGSQIISRDSWSSNLLRSHSQIKPSSLLVLSSWRSKRLLFESQIIKRLKDLSPMKDAVSPSSF